MFGKKDHLAGLDIGSRTIKVGEVAESKGGYALKKFGAINIPPGCIADGVIKEPEIVADAIRELFRENGIKETNVAMSIGGYSVIVKKINVDKMADEKLHETIQFEAEQYIPFDISEVNLDYQMLGESDTNPNQMSVLLVAAKKDMINEYVELARLAKLNPCIIDVDAFALQNIFELNYDSGDENVALIDIGTSKTSLNILKEKSSVFLRDVSLGCGQINQKIISIAKCSPEQAEELKFSKNPDSISIDDLREIFSSVVADWCNEIRRAIDFFYSTYPDEQIQKIVLSGGGANIGEFRQLLATETNASVEMVNPFMKLNAEAGGFDTAFLERMAPQAAICLGLAIRRMDDK